MSNDIWKIGIDMGGTKTESVILSPDGSELSRERRPTEAALGYEHILKNINDLIQSAVSKIPGKAYTLGMGIPGIIDQTGHVANANTTVMIGHPLKSDLEKLTGHPIRIENDANCFTLAEATHGAAQGKKTVFGIIMGTGCGGGISIAGQVMEGATGIAGEWGHVSLDPNGEKCWCGNTGCIETMISGTGVENKHFIRTGQKLKMQEILTNYREGDTHCTATMNQFFMDFGRAVGGIISILDPDAIVIGGGLSLIDELYTEGVKQVRHFTFSKTTLTPILKNKLGDSAGVLGAAWIGI
jgi:fructokinase